MRRQRKRVVDAEHLPTARTDGLGTQRIRGQARRGDASRWQALTAVLPPLLLAASSLAPSPARAQQLTDPRGAFVEEIRNDSSPHQVRVSVDHANHEYRAGESMVVTMRSSRPGFAYLFYAMADGKASCLFPNRFQKDNRIRADQDTIVPGADAGYHIRIGEPFGQEVLKLIVSEKPLRAFDDPQFIASIAAPVTLAAVRGAFVQELRPDSRAWAEHFVKIRTLGGGERAAVPAPARVGLFIGIDVYQDRTIPRLNACVKDAEAMAKVMKASGKLNETIQLKNAQATRSAIERSIRRRLPEMTRPGDEVFIYWSGHGGRCVDDNGDETNDQLDEYLVPHDGKDDALEQVRSTMILDDALGRWMQDLDGRTVTVILDTCHSGGQAGNEKGVGQRAAENPTALDLLDGETGRIKGVGQEIAMLVSSRAAELSFVRKEGGLSVMTSFLVDQMNGPRRLTLAQSHEALQREVPRYVAKNFPGSTQTPELIGGKPDKIWLKP